MPICFERLKLAQERIPFARERSARNFFASLLLSIGVPTSMLRSTKCLSKRIVDPRFSLTARRLRQRINAGTARVVPRSRLNLASTWMSHAVTAARLPSNRWQEMPDTVHSLSTAGLGPKRQIQYWSDALTDLCGHFAVDPLEASTLEARINFTTVSKLKLCQIEASQHRSHTPSRRATAANIPTSKSCSRLMASRISSRTAAKFRSGLAIVSPMTFLLR